MQQHDVVRAGCQERVWQYVDERVGAHLTRLLEALMEYRRDEFVRCAPYEHTTARRTYRNGFYRRWLATTHGQLQLRVPRVRDGAADFDTLVLDRYRRRRPEVDEAIRAWVACGMSVRQVSHCVRHAFGVDLSAAGVSRVLAQVDAEIQAFHTRSLEHGYKYVWLDGKHGCSSHRRRRRGRGKKKKGVMLLAWGRRHEGFEELIEFRAVDKESEKSWTRFLTDLERRGLRRTNRWGQKLEMIGCDGDAGLREALWMVYPTVPKQRCVTHKLRDIQPHLQDQAHRGQIMPEASAIYDDLFSPQQAKRRLELWAKRWRDREPDAVRCFCYEFEDTLTYLNAPAADHSRLRTNNPAERFIRELEKKLRPVGVWPNDRSWERTIYLVWSQLRTQGYAPTRPPRASPSFTHSS